MYSNHSRDQTALIPVFLVLFAAIMYYYLFKMPVNSKDFTAYERVKTYFMDNTKYLLPEARDEFYNAVMHQEIKMKSSQNRFIIFWSEFMLGYYFMSVPAVKFLKYSLSYGEIISVLLLLLLGGVQVISTRVKRKRRLKLKRKKLPRKYLPVKVRAVKREQDKKYLEVIDRIYSLLLTKPVPASIYYHAPYKWGLLYHSIRVAKRTARLLINQRTQAREKVTVGEVLFAFMVGMAHDLGKLEVYYYEKGKDNRSSGWKTRKIPMLPHTKKLFTIAAKGILSDREIQSINKIFDEKPVHITKMHLQFRRLVKEADSQVTAEEMFQIRDSKTLLKSFKDALWNLNINAVLSADADGFYIPSKHVVVVMTGKLAKEVTNDMVSKLGEKARELGAGERGSKKVHPILPPLTRVLAEYDWIYKEFDGVKGDAFMSYDVVIDKVEFKSVLLIKSDKIPRELRKRWISEFAYKVENLVVKSRLPVESMSEEQEADIIEDITENADDTNTEGKEIAQKIPEREESDVKESENEKTQHESDNHQENNKIKPENKEQNEKQDEQQKLVTPDIEQAVETKSEQQNGSDSDVLGKVQGSIEEILFIQERKKPKKKG